MAAWSDHQATWQKPRPKPQAKELPGSLNPTDGEWDLFTDEALIELLADASSELGRRGKDILVGSSKRVTA